MDTQTKTKKKQKNYANQNPLEALVSLGSDVSSSLVDDLGAASPKAAWESLLSGASGGSTEEGFRRSSGDLTEGQEISFEKRQKSEQREARLAPAIDYTREVIDSGKSILRENQQTIQSQVQEILIELKKISETSSEIAMEFKEISVEQRIENPGEYHVNFFSWILSLFRTARVKLEDSRAGLSLVQNKGKQKKYWAMFKKHGTTFGLSNERVVATQAG